MERRPFSEVLKNKKIDFLYEYQTLFFMFYHKGIDYAYISSTTIRQLCGDYFLEFPIRDTFVTLDDFEERNHFVFEENPRDFDINYLINFSEYSYNLVVCCKNIMSKRNPYMFDDANFPLNIYIEQVCRVIAKIGYIPNNKDNITTFVPRSQTAISVAEIIDPELSFDVIEYNHHSMKGDIERKTRILEALAKRLEPKRGQLHEINEELEDKLFDLYNNFHLRHNNEEGKFKKPYVVNMSNDEREPYYDDIYQMSLLAFLLLDNEDRKERITELLSNINRKQ